MAGLSRIFVPALTKLVPHKKMVCNLRHTCCSQENVLFILLGIGLFIFDCSPPNRKKNPRQDDKHKHNSDVHLKPPICQTQKQFRFTIEFLTDTWTFLGDDHNRSRRQTDPRIKSSYMSTMFSTSAYAIDNGSGFALVSV